MLKLDRRRKMNILEECRDNGLHIMAAAVESEIAHFDSKIAEVERRLRGDDVESVTEVRR